MIFLFKGLLCLSAICFFDFFFFFFFLHSFNIYVCIADLLTYRDNVFTQRSEISLPFLSLFTSHFVLEVAIYVLRNLYALRSGK